MRFLMSVLTDRPAPATSAEGQSIDAFNQRLREEGHWILAVGLREPESATVVDSRGPEPTLIKGPANTPTWYTAGLWIIEASSHQEALELTQDASKACQRRVELREIL